MRSQSTVPKSLVGLEHQQSHQVSYMWHTRRQSSHHCRLQHTVPQYNNTDHSRSRWNHTVIDLGHSCKRCPWQQLPPRMNSICSSSSPDPSPHMWSCNIAMPHPRQVSQLVSLAQRHIARYWRRWWCMRCQDYSSIGHRHRKLCRCNPIARTAR